MKHLQSPTHRPSDLWPDVELAVDGPRGICAQQSGIADDLSRQRSTPCSITAVDWKNITVTIHGEMGVIEHFELNLRRLVRLANQADVPIMIINPVSNLRDSPPFKTENQQSLPQDKKDAFTQLWKEAKAHGMGLSWTERPHYSNRLWRLTIVTRTPTFLMAKVYDAMGKVRQAKAEYLRAKDEDICPLRMLERMHEITLRTARQTKTPLLDVRRVFEEEAAGGIPGDDELIDHVHPRIDGSPTDR